MEQRIKYTALNEGPYKYKLEADYYHEIKLPLLIRRKVGVLMAYSTMGLILKKGYATDGPSGPTVDTESFMRAAFVHDGLYQMLREGILPESFRKRADKELRRLCIEDGMSKFRARYIYWGVRWFGAKYAKFRAS